MGKNPSDPKRVAMPGELLSQSEIHKRYDITREEAESFRPFTRIYRQDSLIIREGDTDKTLYLVRGGTVGIFKKIGDKQEMIAQIEAVNFVGEMSLINDAPRTATVTALSEVVLIYAIPSPNFHLILSNPHWAEILLTRFSKDLKQANNQLGSAAVAIQELNGEVSRLKDEVEKKKLAIGESQEKTKKLLNITLALLETIRDQSTFGSKGWFFVQICLEIIEQIAGESFPGLKILGEDANFRKIREHLDAAQKAESRPNLGPVYENIKANLDM